MSLCRYDRDRDAYLVDGEPCRVDEYGDPTKHCTARRTCNQHIGRAELTCNTCIARARANLRQIAELSALMLPAAIAAGVNSEAASLAGPAADDSVFTARREIGKRWIMANLPPVRWEDAACGLLEPDDELHPYSLLTRWQAMLTEDYGHPVPERYTVADACAYLERNLHVVAQDPEQDFSLLAREVRRCRQHLESVLHNSHQPERGAPCPECVAAGNVNPKHVRLVREYGHWCEDADCERIHYDDDGGDVWRCPRNRVAHVWTHAAYENYLEDRKAGA